MLMVRPRLIYDDDAGKIPKPLPRSYIPAMDPEPFYAKLYRP